MNAQMSVCESSPFEMSDSIYNMNAKPNDDSIFNLNSNSRFEETFPARQEFYENEPRQQSFENERFQPSQESFEIENFYQQQSFEEQPYIDENQVCLTNVLYVNPKLQANCKTLKPLKNNDFNLKKTLQF
jgi:hypothetical protein